MSRELDRNTWMRDDADAYEPDNPKHYDYGERIADLADIQRKREKEDREDPCTDPRPDPRTHPEYWTE